MDMQPSEQPIEHEQRDISPTPPTAHSPSQTHTSSLSTEEIRLGKVYPPPAEFFQALPSEPSPHWLPGAPILVTARRTPPLPPPPALWTTERPTPTARPRSKLPAWLRILISVASVAILLSLGACSWTSYQLFALVYQQVNGSMSVINDYYGAIQAKHYTTAYADLAPNGSIANLTQDHFIQQAQLLDTQDGAITNYTPGFPNYSYTASSLPDLSSLTLPVTIERAKSSYTVTLTLQKVHGVWKITDFTKI